MSPVLSYPTEILGAADFPVHRILRRNVKVRIHRGCHEIGGSCVEVYSQGKRLVLDVGKPLSAGWDEHVTLPAVPGLASGDPSVLGVLISHGHLDHYGLIDQVAPTVPVLCGRAAADVVNAARFFSPGPALSPTACFQDRVPMSLGPFTVTPTLVDHSAYDAYALIIDADGRRLCYTGDLRGHGRKASTFERLLVEPPTGVGTLLMEGTHVPGDVPGDTEPVMPTEQDVERDMTQTFLDTKATALVLSSAQNVDRLVTVYKAARAAGRTLVMDLYTATVATATGRASIPRPGFPGVGVYLPRRQRTHIVRSGEFARTTQIRPFRVFPEQLRADPKQFVVLTSSSAALELLELGTLDDGVAVWSLWSGYLQEPSGQRLQALLDEHEVPLVEHHTSGHASVTDLRRLVDAVKPERVVPIHTEGAQQYAQHFTGTSAHADGDWWAA